MPIVSAYDRRSTARGGSETARDGLRTCRGLASYRDRASRRTEEAEARGRRCPSASTKMDGAPPQRAPPTHVATSAPDHRSSPSSNSALGRLSAHLPAARGRSERSFPGSTLAEQSCRAVYHGTHRCLHTRAPFDAVDQDNPCKIWTRRRRRRAEMLVARVGGASVRLHSVRLVTCETRDMLGRARESKIGAWQSTRNFELPRGPWTHGRGSRVRAAPVVPRFLPRIPHLDPVLFMWSSV